MTQPHTPPSPPPAHSHSPPMSAVPTTQLTLDRIRLLCRPIFEEEQLNNPLIAWAGIYGSVQRGTQRPDSDVNFLVGYAANADFNDDIDECYGYEELERRLAEILDRKIGLVVFTQDDDYLHASVYMEALLTAETIWGNPTWKYPSRKAAERLLREGYKRAKQALQVASRLKERLPSSQAEFISPKNKALRLSVLEDALFVVTIVKFPMNPFYSELRSTIPRLLANEDAIRAAIEGEVESTGDLRHIWNVLSDRRNTVALKWMMKQAEQAFSFSGLVP